MNNADRAGKGLGGGLARPGVSIKRRVQKRRNALNGVEKKTVLASDYGWIELIEGCIER